jgi:hypothetical protein
VGRSPTPWRAQSRSARRPSQRPSGSRRMQSSSINNRSGS